MNLFNTQTHTHICVSRKTHAHNTNTANSDGKKIVCFYYTTWLLVVNCTSTHNNIHNHAFRVLLHTHKRTHIQFVLLDLIYNFVLLFFFFNFNIQHFKNAIRQSLVFISNESMYMMVAQEEATCCTPLCIHHRIRIYSM